MVLGFNYRIATAVVVLLAVQKKIPVGRAAVLPRAGSTPLLVSPQGGVEVGNGNGDSDDSDQSASTSTSISTSTSSSTSTTLHSTTTKNKPSSSNSDTSSLTSASVQQSSTTTSTTSATAASTTPHSVYPDHIDPSTSQPSSIRYLIPVFLFVLLTVLVIIYRRYRKRARQRRAEQQRGLFPSPPGSPPRGSGIGAGRAEDPRDTPLKKREEGDEWDVESDAEFKGEGHAYIGFERSGGIISVAALPWWKGGFTPKGWRSARERDPYAEEGATSTIKLVAGGVSYQTIPNLAKYTGSNLQEQVGLRNKQEQRGSIKALRDKLLSLTTSRSNVAGHAQLRNQSTQIQRPAVGTRPRSGSGTGVGGVTFAPDPELPAELRAGAISPSNTILSPPMQPGLFFHPHSHPPEGLDVKGARGDISISDWSESGLGSENPSIATGLDEVVDMQTSTKAKAGMESERYGAGGTAKIPRTIRLQDLIPSTPNRPSQTPVITTTSPTPTATARKKSRIRGQRKEDHARDKVEEILTASWSDRALASPTSPSIDGLVSMVEEMQRESAAAAGAKLRMSPGTEEMGSGIDARLAMIRALE